MAKFFYNFCFPDGDDGYTNHGFYYLSQKEDFLYSHTEFSTPDGPYQNIFQIKFEQDRVLAYKHNESAWVDVAVGQYPTSAYPLVLAKATTDGFSYVAISEDTGEVLGDAVLKQSGDDIIETVNDNVIRRFSFTIIDTDIDTGNRQGSSELDYVATKIDWGGAVSFLCNDEIEAVKGTSLTISEDILLK